MNAESTRPPGNLRLLAASLCLAVFLAACAVYLRCLPFGFINIDDSSYVTHNAHLREGFTRSGLTWAFTSFDPDNWFPLTRLSHMLDYALFGLNAPWHRGENILIHALASLLLYAFLRRATGQPWPSLFVAAVFALHPMHVESVAWISERKDVLCAFFWFAALWAWVGYAQRPSLRRYLFALFLFAAGLMSKPMIVTFPLLLPILDIWPLKRPFSRHSVLRYLPFWILSLAVSILTVLAQGSAGAVRSLDSFPVSLRLGNAFITVWIYIGRALWPVDLFNPYPWPQHVPLWQSVPAFLAIAAVSVAALAWRRDRPWLLAGWSWLLITLIPVIGVLQVGPTAGADRYMYVPMVGLLIIAAWTAADIFEVLRGQWSPVPLAAGAAASAILICLTLAGLTWSQQQYWQDSITVFRHAIAVDDRNYLAWEYLGNSMDKEHHLDARIECLRIASDIRPDIPEFHSEYGKALLNGYRIQEAEAAFGWTLQISPRDTEARVLLGFALLLGDDLRDALTQFRTAVRLRPDSAMAYNDLAVALLRTRPQPSDADVTEAVACLRRAISLSPGDPVPYANLGFVLLPESPEAAAAEFVHALILDPNQVEAHLGQASVLALPPFLNHAGAADHLNTARLLEPDPGRIRELGSPQFEFAEFR